MNKLIRGSCLCGSVRFEVDPPFLQASHCHCDRCRKHSGTAVCTQARVRREQFRLLQGEKLIKVYGRVRARLRRSVLTAAPVCSAVIGRTDRKCRFAWARSTMIQEFGRNFILLSVIARHGTRSPIIFRNMLKGGRDLICGSK